MGDSPGRRLAAIVCMDVAGYSRLVEGDEDATLARLRAVRRDVIAPLLARHGGRLFKTMGDGALAEFASPVEAVRAAIEIQTALADREPEVPPDRRFMLRIGINLGDVVADDQDGDLYGDGVNVAARLEAIAEPGGICISAAVQEHLLGRVKADIEDIGAQHLKNIARPIHAYRVRCGALAPPSNCGPDQAVSLGLPDKPSIAVLPFDTLSDDPEQRYFSDGIVEDLITELSRFRSLFVVARNSSFAFRDRPVDIAGIGRRLGVQFLAEGSIRKAGKRFRITVQLVEAASANHLWAERYDCEAAEIFAVQDEVVATIAATIAGRLDQAGIERAKRKPAASLAAYDCVLRGRDALAGEGEEANLQAAGLFEQAVALDPGYALGHAYLGLALYAEQFRRGGTDFQPALDMARKALELDPNDSRCHRILAEIHLATGHYERADYHSGHGLALNPNDADAAAFRAYILMHLGRPQEGVDWIERAMRLNPFYPHWYCNTQARALHCAGRHAEAIRIYERLANPRFFHHAYLAACHAALGNAEAAQFHVARTLAGKPDFSTASWVADRPFFRPEDRQALLREMLAAGLPA